MTTTRSWAFFFNSACETRWLCCSPVERGFYRTVTLLAWYVGMWGLWVGTRQPAKVTGATATSQSASFRKRGAVLRDLSATSHRMGQQQGWEGHSKSMLLSQTKMLVQRHPTMLCTDATLLQQIKLPSTRMKCYLRKELLAENWHYCFLAVMRLRETIYYHYNIPASTQLYLALHLCLLIAEAKENKHIKHMHTLL